WHRYVVTGAENPQGWRYQLPAEPQLNIHAERRRVLVQKTSSRWGRMADLVPHYGYDVGTVFDRLIIGCKVRVGMHMRDPWGGDKMPMSVPPVAFMADANAQRRHDSAKDDDAYMPRNRRSNSQTNRG